MCPLPFLYLGNTRDTLKFGTWLETLDQLAVRFIEDNGGVRLQVRTAFRTSGTAGRFALKIGVWLWDQWS